MYPRSISSAYINVLDYLIFMSSSLQLINALERTETGLLRSPVMLSTIPSALDSFNYIIIQPIIHYTVCEPTMKPFNRYLLEIKVPCVWPSLHLDPQK